MIVAAIKDQIRRNWQRKDGQARNVISPSSAGACERALVLRGVGAPSTHEPDYVIDLVFMRGHGAEEVLAPYVLAALPGRVITGGPCCGRKGLHVEMATPKGRTVRGHIDLLVLDKDGVPEVNDYKSVGPDAFDWRLSHGAEPKNVEQVNLYLHGLREGEVRLTADTAVVLDPKAQRHAHRWRLVYYDVDSGRLHEEEGEYDALMAARTLDTFDLVQDRIDAYHKAMAQHDGLMAAQATTDSDEDVPVPNPLVYAGPKPYDDAESFPCAYVKRGTKHLCPFWGYCYGQEALQRVLDEDKVVQLGPEYEGTLARYVELRNDVRVLEKERARLRTLVGNAVREAGALQGEAGEYNVRISKRQRSTVDQAKLPPDVAAVATRVTEYEVVDVNRKPKG